MHRKAVIVAAVSLTAVVVLSGSTNAFAKQSLRKQVAALSKQVKGLKDQVENLKQQAKKAGPQGDKGATGTKGDKGDKGDAFSGPIFHLGDLAQKASVNSTDLALAESDCPDDDQVVIGGFGYGSTAAIGFIPSARNPYTNTFNFAGYGTDVAAQAICVDPSLVTTGP